MENETIKTSRASQTRDKVKKPTTWTPPNSLDAPPAPKGYRHRWIRVEILGSDDTKNVSARLREGWELVRADEYPESDYPTMDHKSGKYQGVIGVGALCWQGYLKKSHSNVKRTINNKRKNATMQ